MKIYKILSTIAPYGDLKNTPKTPLIDGDNISKNLKIIVDNIDTFNKYMSNPSCIIKNMWNAVVKNSFNICLFISLLGFLLYVLGYRKGNKLTFGGMAIYFLIKCLSFI